jgi:hypothetical protein
MHDLPILPDRDRLVTDAVIHHLALDEADLRARIADLEADNSTLREMLQASLDVAHILTRERNDYRTCYHAALDENRQLRTLLGQAA